MTRDAKDRILAHVSTWLDEAGPEDEGTLDTYSGIHECSPSHLSPPYLCHCLNGSRTLDLSIRLNGGAHDTVGGPLDTCDKKDKEGSS